jgi:hypothetical protein
VESGQNSSDGQCVCSNVPVSFPGNIRDDAEKYKPADFLRLGLGSSWLFQQVSMHQDFPQDLRQLSLDRCLWPTLPCLSIFPGRAPSQMVEKAGPSPFWTSAASTALEFVEYRRGFHGLAHFPSRSAARPSSTSCLGRFPRSRSSVGFSMSRS